MTVAEITIRGRTRATELTILQDQMEEKYE